MLAKQWKKQCNTLIEIEEQRKENLTKDILKDQILSSLPSKIDQNKIIIAYEPVWSIGTGLIPKINQLENQIFNIKKILFNLWKLKNPKILYGGSVNPNNVRDLKKISSINGFLIGGASQKSKNFIDIIKKSIN